MAGNWMDERERMLRERDGRGLGQGPRERGAEDRSWERDRVFGERESGASYGRTDPGPYRGAAPAPRGWQDPDYGGVSPAMRQGGGYGRGRFPTRERTGGGRFYGDDDRQLIYREEYSQGGVDYGDAPGGYAAGGFSPARPGDFDQGYGRSTFAGRSGELPGDPRSERFEDAGRHAGEFLHRAGEKVAAWFAGGGEGRIYDPDYLGAAPKGRADARGLGPQGYKRSDERISDDAHERLTEDAWLDASNVSISVSDGEITLAGTVETREAKHRAERIVEELSGVTHVQNNLRVAKGSYFTRPASGYGDSVLGAQMRAAQAEPAADGSGGAGGGQSTAGRKA